jgi:hypothetical protein
MIQLMLTFLGSFLAKAGGSVSFIKAALLKEYSLAEAQRAQRAQSRAL